MLNRNLRYSIINLIIFLTICHLAEAQEMYRVKYQGEPLDTILKTLGEQSEKDFSYSGELDNDITVDFECAQCTFEDILKGILEPHHLGYLRVGRQYIIKEIKRELYFFLEGRVLNSKGEGIAFATIQKPKSSQGVVADAEGYFSMSLAWDQKPDSLFVSAAGYDGQSFPISGNQHSVNWTLDEYLIELAQVTVVGREYERVMLDRLDLQSDGSIYMDTHGQQTALFIERPESLEEAWFSKLYFYLDEEGNTSAPFRIRIYQRKENTELPGQDLLQDFLVIQPKGESGWVEVDVSELDISFPATGAFIAIEGVYPGDHALIQYERELNKKRINKKELMAQVAYGQRLGFHKSRENHTWYYSPSQTWFQLEYSKYDVMISAELFYKEEDHE